MRRTFVLTLAITFIFRRGRQLSRRKNDNIWFCQNFQKNCMKLRKFWVRCAPGAPQIRHWFLCSFRQKSCQIIDFEPKLRGWRPLSPSWKYWIRHWLRLLYCTVFISKSKNTKESVLVINNTYPVHKNSRLCQLLVLELLCQYFLHQGVRAESSRHEEVARLSLRHGVVDMSRQVETKGVQQRPGYVLSLEISLNLKKNRWVPKCRLATRKHSSRMRTARLSTIRVVAATRCQ